jgi:hypothetical protein
MFLKKIILCLSFLLAFIFCFGQKYVQVETVNRLKVKRFTIGTELTFQLKGKDQPWYTRTITGIVPEQNIILFDNEMVKIQNIQFFRFQRVFLQGFAKQLYRFGVAWVAYGAIADVFDQYTLKKSDGYVAATAIASGFLLQKGFKYKYTRFGRRKRLRLIDLSFK